MDQIVERIQDRDDDPTDYVIVGFLPMANSPIPTDEISFGKLKALFGNEG